MQREIEELLRAIHVDQRQEQKLVNDVLAAIAVGSAARRRMIQDIANAVLQAMDTNDGAPESTASSLRVGGHPQQTTERELTDALQSMLRDAERRSGSAH